jgi:tetratricopeptide (TPR) repeat protein
MREHYLPFLRELQSRNVSEQSKSWTDLHDLVAVSGSLGRTYNAVGQFEEASRFLRQAQHVLGVMRSRFPNDAQIAAEHPLAEAELGHFLLARGSDEGLKHLQLASNSIQRLVERDPANVNSAEHQIKIIRLCALGFAEWSADALTPLFERQKRASDAQQHLERAESLLARLDSQSLRGALAAELEDARKKVAAAKAKFAGLDSPSSQAPKHAP